MKIKFKQPFVLSYGQGPLNDKLITARPPVNIPNFKKDHLIYILDLITSIPATNKAMDLIDGFVPIHAAILQSRLKTTGSISTTSWKVRYC